MSKDANIKIGDSVAVKDGIRCPDIQPLSMDGWQGRVAEIFDAEGDKVMINIKLDSITLRSFSQDYIRQSKVGGLDWTSMNLWLDDVKPAQPRDTEKDVELVVGELFALHSWDDLGEEGARIGSVLKDVDPDDMYACVEAWGEHLEKVLVFPFDTIIVEGDYRGPLKYGDKLRVHSINVIDDHYGVIVNVRLGRLRYDHPLCDLEVLDKKSPNYQNVMDYVVWFANR